MMHKPGTKNGIIIDVREALVINVSKTLQGCEAFVMRISSALRLRELILGKCVDERTA